MLIIKFARGGLKVLNANRLEREGQICVFSKEQRIEVMNKSKLSVHRRHSQTYNVGRNCFLFK